MPYLKKVKINNNDYYYLFHTVRVGDKYRKLSKYIGKDLPENIDKIKSDFLKEIKNQPLVENDKPELNVVAILQDLQDQKGYLSKEDMANLAKKFNIPGVNIYGVATFYSMFKLNPQGKHVISVCTGTACHVKNSSKLVKYLEELLDIKSEETTKDNRFTLQSVNCIGACAKAPAMMINEKVYGDLDKDKIKNIIENLR